MNCNHGCHGTKNECIQNFDLNLTKIFPECLEISLIFPEKQNSRFSRMVDTLINYYSLPNLCFKFTFMGKKSIIRTLQGKKRIFCLHTHTTHIQTH